MRTLCSVPVLIVVLLWNFGVDAVHAAGPNIIFLMTDDLGYADIGPYGQMQLTTPHLDRLAAEGMKFTDYYAGSTVCAPSRCVLLTGLHTGHAEIRGNAGGPSKPALRPETVTFGEVLQQAGYVTSAYGKWALGPEGSTGVPLAQGFNEFTGYIDQSHAHNYYTEFLVRGNVRFKLNNVVPNPGPYGQGVATVRNDYSHDVIMKDALAFLERKHDTPFCMYLAITLPHANNEGREAGMEVPSYGEYADRDWTIAEKGFAAMIRRIDDDVGLILAKLKELGIDDNTLFVFTSDNGPHREGGHDPDFFDSNGALRGYKRDLYEGGIRVPMIARWPGRIAPGSVTGHIASHADVLATLGELAETTVPAGLDSISFLPTLLGRPDQKVADFLYWEAYEQGYARAVRRGPWKYINGRDGEMLFNLNDDLGEQNNVAAQHPEILAQCRADAEASHVDHPLWPTTGGGRGGRRGARGAGNAPGDGN